MGNVDAKAATGGVTDLVLDKCWRCGSTGLTHLNKDNLYSTPYRKNA